MLREITIFLHYDAAGWRVVPDEEVQRLILSSAPALNETWRVLKVAIETIDSDYVPLQSLREDLDRLLVNNVTRRVNDDQEDPMTVAEDEAAHLETVEHGFIEKEGLAKSEQL